MSYPSESCDRRREVSVALSGWKLPTLATERRSTVLPFQIGCDSVRPQRGRLVGGVKKEIAGPTIRALSDRQDRPCCPRSTSVPNAESLRAKKSGIACADANSAEDPVARAAEACLRIAPGSCLTPIEPYRYRQRLLRIVGIGVLNGARQNRRAGRETSERRAFPVGRRGTLRRPPQRGIAARGTAPRRQRFRAPSG